VHEHALAFTGMCTGICMVGEMHHPLSVQR